MSNSETFDAEILVVDFDVVNSFTKESLSYVLCRFLSEITKNDSNDYPGKTWHKMLMSIRKDLNQNNVP